MAGADGTVAVAVPAVVLDTNVVLDWLVFAEFHATRLGHAIASGAVQWVRTASMADELQRVLNYPQLQRYNPDPAAVMDSAARHARLLGSPPPLPMSLRIRCTDPDDQMFIDLALSHRTAWLLSRDHAVLRLARRAARHGVSIVPPARWQPS